MEKTITNLIFLILGLIEPSFVKAQGTVYLSNLQQASAGSLAAGSNSWQAALFHTGTNVGGYLFNSVELTMTEASGNPSNFMVMLYNAPPGPGALPGISLGNFVASLDPTIAGVYTNVAPSNLVLSPSTYYFIVLTCGTGVANGAYNWSYAAANSYNTIAGWSSGASGHVWASANGINWNSFSGFNPQFAIDATAIPEPGVLSLFALGGLGFLWHRRKASSR